MGRRARATVLAARVTTDRRGALVARDSVLGQPRAWSAREAIFRPTRPQGALVGLDGGGGRRCVTPRQTCPRPNGLGRNLRSKTRWFTGFCNSHQVSHFATFFIDARAEISVAESRFRFSIETARPRARTANGLRRRALSVGVPWRDSRRGFVVWPRGTGRRGPPSEDGRADASRLHGTAGARGRLAPSPPRCVVNESTGRSAGQVSTMILPQVHLRKPCYDFSFL